MAGNQATTKEESVAKGSNPRRSVVCISAAVCTVLAAPGAAPAEIDQSSVSFGSEISAQAWDGAGKTPPDADFDDDTDFATFDETARARDRNRDSGRSGRAEVTQSTQILSLNGTFMGVDSTGLATGSWADPNLSDGFVPFGNALSKFELEFDVVNSPVGYSINGTQAVDATPATPQCTDAEVGTFPGFATISSGCAEGPESENLDLAGTLDPGSHDFEINLRTLLSSGLATAGTGRSEYDISLRFCTIVAQTTTTNGTSGNDVICGFSDPETINGLGGNDIIFAAGGGDTIDGGAGDDRIFGDEGDDARIYGGPGDDTIDAGPGNDGPADPTLDLVIAGGPGNDQIFGGPGDDELVGRCLDLALGTPSPICPSDPPTGGESDDDNLDGGPGNDALFGDAGTNLIVGGSGNDTSTADGPAANTFLMGPGKDTSLGGDGPDRIEGEDGNDLLGGLAGNDCIIGGTGKDDLSGLAGNDTLLAKDGRRDGTIIGGPGPDKGRFDGQDRVRSVTNQNFQGGC